MEECCHSAGHHEAGANPHPTADTAAASGTLRFIVPALVVVTVVLGIQTLQLVGLQRSFKGGVAAAATSAPAAAASTSGAAPPLPSSLQNLPNMVGGC